MKIIIVSLLASMFYTPPSGVLRVYGICKLDTKITKMAQDFSFELWKLGIYKETGFICKMRI